MAPSARVVQGNSTCTTLANPPRMEIYPVGTLTPVDSNDPINKLKNPSTVVILGDDEAADHNIAIFEITRYLPKNLNIQPDDPRVVWRVNNGLPSGGDAKFYKGDNTGLCARVYGTRPGEILLEADYGCLYPAVMRVLVAPLRKVKFRVSRLSTHSLPPKNTIAEIKDHIAIANIYLRQAGIQLVPSERTDTAKAAGNPKAGTSTTDPLIISATPVEPGYFDVELQDSSQGKALIETGESLPNQWKAILVNAINETINISYASKIQSRTTVMETDYLGHPTATQIADVVAACRLLPFNHGTDRPGTTRPANVDLKTVSTITDSTSAPTTSWIAPNGFPRGSICLPAEAVKGFSEKRPKETYGQDHARRDGCGEDPTLSNGHCSPRQSKDPPVKMNLMGAIPPLWQPGTPATREFALQWGIVVGGSQKIDGKKASPQIFGHYLAHELGHFFGLQHRGPKDDGLSWPQWENLMQFNGVYPDSQNLDILQCKAMRFSEIMYRPNALAK